MYSKKYMKKVDRYGCECYDALQKAKALRKTVALFSFFC